MICWKLELARREFAHGAQTQTRGPAMPTVKTLKLFRRTVIVGVFLSGQLLPDGVDEVMGEGTQGMAGINSSFELMSNSLGGVLDSVPNSLGTTNDKNDFENF